jgi:hypothetical protein
MLTKHPVWAMLPTLFLCLFLQATYAQHQITGFIDEGKNKPLPGASVLLLSTKDSSLVKGRLSGTDGGYKLEDIPEGTYFLRVTMIGFQDYQSDIFTVADNKTLPTVTLSESSTQINEVQIVAKKPFFEQKIDRMLINVASSRINAGGNALQVLQRSPGVLVNKQSNSISMTGKFGVIIMINGKVSRMPPDAILQMLEGMSSDNIERIELIHTPPASFDAEGSAGIINIVLKQSPDAGLNGGYSVNSGYGKREKYGAGMNFNYRKKKVNLFGNYSYQFDHNPQVFTNYRGIKRDGNFIETDGTSTRSPDLANQNARMGADFQVSKKTVIGIVGTFFDRNWEMNAMNNIIYSTNGIPDYTVQMTTKEVNKWTSGTANLNFSHQFDDKKSLTMDADYVYYKIHNPSDYNIATINNNGNPSTPKKLKVGKENPIQIAVGKADYVQDFGKETRFEAGLKATMSFFDNDVRVENQTGETPWVVNPSLTSRFKLTEDVAAAYSSLAFKANAKTDIKIGLRYEYTNTNLGSVERPNVVDRQYGSFFPSIYVSRKITEEQQLNMSYSRRIARPGFTQLAPYLIFYDPSSIQSGNPSLQPSFVHAIRTDYRYKVYSLTVEYNRESPSIRDIPIINIAENTQVLQPENIGVTYTAFAVVNAPWQPAKWWEMQNNVFVAWQLFDLNYVGTPLKIPTKFLGFNSVHSFKLPKKWSVEVSGGMITANSSGVFKYKANGQLNFGIQKELGERWGKLNLNVTDLFMTNNYFGTASQPELNLLVRNSYQQAERVFMLTWTNKFGNNKLKESRQRERGASEELRRL